MDNITIFGEKTQVQLAQDMIKRHRLPLNLCHIAEQPPKALTSNMALMVGQESLFLLKKNIRSVQKIGTDWLSLQKRIVNAGRKSELVLQATKLTAGMSVIDGMAGFGHDGLILASTGAMVDMVESNPVMALLLFFEYEKMCTYSNWQNLLARIRICYDDFLNVHQDADLVYLDPMFPLHSYRAKVGKHMQFLHDTVAPPSADNEHVLLRHAQTLAQTVIVKRPIGAPHFAQTTSSQCWQNNAIRFDRYQQ